MTSHSQPPPYSSLYTDQPHPHPQSTAPSAPSAPSAPPQAQAPYGSYHASSNFNNNNNNNNNPNNIYNKNNRANAYTNYYDSLNNNNISLDHHAAHQTLHDDDVVDDTYMGPVHETKFQQRTCRDAIWAILFLVHLVSIIFFGLANWFGFIKDLSLDNSSYASSRHSSSSSSSLHTLSSSVPSDVIRLVLILCAASAAMCAIFLKMLQSNATMLVWFSLLFNIVATLSLALFFLLCQELVAAIVFMAIAILQSIYVIAVRSRIQFAAAMLDIISGVVQLFPSLIGVCLLGMVVQAGWMCLWLFCAASIVSGQDDETYSSTAQVWTQIALVLSFFWTTIVISNVVHVTVAGVVATWYFVYPNAAARNATCHSLGRALSLSFGSICLGSLMVALLRTIRFFVQQMLRADHECVRAIVTCLLDLIESAIQFFNVYAYSYVSIYGECYTSSAAHAWELLSTKGMQALINDDLATTVMMAAATINAAAGAGLGGGLAKFVFFLDSWGTYAVVGAFLGFMTMMCALEVMTAGITCLFVCFADDPGSLEHSKPLVYAKLVSAYENCPAYCECEERDGCH